jgi:D-alanine-D-alanine ligase
MNPNPSRNIGVFFGSRSPEHDVSIITACLVMSGLKAIGYNVVPVYISKEGDWCIDESLSSLDTFKRADFKDYLSRLPRYSLNLELSKGVFSLESKGMWQTKNVVINVAFPCFHGQNGEDGTIQGLFEIANVPYVGCGVTASATTMDKVLTKELYITHNIPTTEFVYFSESEWKEFESDIRSQISSIGYPVFVKPARAGSSIGISRVTNEGGLSSAVELGFHFDTKVLVEKGVSNLADLTVAVMGNSNDPESIRTSLIQESRFSDDFFTYEEKYLNEGGAQLGNATKNLIIPAEIDEKVTGRVESMAAHIYRVFECSGTARVDFLYDRESGKIYANEINPLPGTLYHHLWKDSGVSFAELLRELIRLADKAHESKKKITSTFSSDILKHIGEGKLSKKLQ